MRNKYRHTLLILIATAFFLPANATADDESPEPSIVLNITKSEWASIGNDKGEAIGFVQYINGSDFDHFSAEIRCQEDADQYITFADVTTNGDSLRCYTWEGGHYTLNNGYHYTITVEAFDVPYYGVPPVATATYEFVGTGEEVEKFCEMEVTGVSMTVNDLMLDGYYSNGNTFEITFNEPASSVTAWVAMGMDGSNYASAAPKNTDKTIWTITLPNETLDFDGSVNVLIQVWNADGVQAKGTNSEHAFCYNIVIVPITDGIINAGRGEKENKCIFSINGKRINNIESMKEGIYIIGGKKYWKKAK